MKRRFQSIALLMGTIILTLTSIGCNHGKSYAELLRDETKAINRYLADQRVVGHKPADGNFEVGPDAPYYRMDDEGNVYMRVINKGDMENRAETNDLVYFRYTLYDLNDYVDGKLPDGYGNAEDVTYPEQFRYKNFNTSAGSYNWGEGIQLPLDYLGYGCEVEMVVRSQMGIRENIASVIPYLYRVRYYKSRI